MNKELIINVTSEEIVIALFEDKLLVELNKESCKSGFAVGDICLGKVKKIMLGLNAAFVNIGYGKDGFIHYLDLGMHFENVHRYVTDLNSGKKTPAFENLRLDKALEKGGKISSQIAGGQTILVQIAKEAISTKGPRLTSDISIAGRNVVLIPFSNKISISQKIRSNAERTRLKKIASKVLPKNYGVIIRTAATGKGDEDVEQDIQSLVEKWQNTIQAIKTQSAPSVVLSEMSRTTSIIRDLLNGTFSSIYVDNKEIYEEVLQYIRNIAPDKEKIVKFYKGSVPIFDNFDVSKQIMSLFSMYVSLKKGAYLIIEHTEALHVIDVNSGNRTKVGDDQERTALDVNLTAAAEIARQLRLRDMGGIIVVDFIDMHKAEHRTEVFNAMKQLMSADRAKHTILPLSKFGLMQITRQRVRSETHIDMREQCPTCQGSGKTSPSAILDQEIENQIAYFAGEGKQGYVKLVVNPIVAAYLTKGLVSIRMKWMMRYKIWIDVTSDTKTGIIGSRFYNREGKELK